MLRNEYDYLLLSKEISSSSLIYVRNIRSGGLQTAEIREMKIIRKYLKLLLLRTQKRNTMRERRYETEMLRENKHYILRENMMLCLLHSHYQTMFCGHAVIIINEIIKTK